MFGWIIYHLTFFTLSHLRAIQKGVKWKNITPKSRMYDVVEKNVSEMA